MANVKCKKPGKKPTKVNDSLNEGFKYYNQLNYVTPGKAFNPRKGTEDEPILVKKKK